MPKFAVVSEYTPSGDQPEAIEALAHNHVSGVAMFSSADVRTTLELRDLLRQVHVELVDHFVVAANEMISMAATGYLED